MKRLIALFLTLILCVTLCACGGSEPPEPTPTPTPAPTPVPTLSPEELAAKYNDDMAAAIGSDDRAPLTAGKAVTYWEDKDKVGTYNTKLLADEWIAKAPDEAKFIVRRTENARVVGMYIGTIGGNAYQRYVRIEILNSVTDDVLADKSFSGGDPPETITLGVSPYGSYPDEAEIEQWILTMLPELAENEKEAAKKQAISRLKHQNYSKEDLRNHLNEQYGFTPEEAAYAVENCGADWKEVALKATKNYLNSYAQSRNAMFKVLTEYWLFTEEEANYALENCGADWGSQSTAVVDQVLSSGDGYSRDGLIDALVTYKSMSQEDAELAVDAAGIDWNEQAVLAADEHLNGEYAVGYSPDRLVSWMSTPISDYGDGFTEEQARYALEHVTTDWNKQAELAAAKWVAYYEDGYWDESLYGPYNQETLIRCMTEIDGFTAEQTQYALTTVSVP